MILLINPVSPSIELIIVEGVEVRHQSNIQSGDEADVFPERLVKLLDIYTITEIWCITGPGMFTRVRIVTLAINTLSRVRHLAIKGCHFFDIVDSPSPILRANDTEYIIRETHERTKLISKYDIEDGEYIGYGEPNDFTAGKNLFPYKYNMDFTVSVFNKIESSNTLNPIYLKDPHITWPKKYSIQMSERMKTS